MPVDARDTEHKAQLEDRRLPQPGGVLAVHDEGQGLLALYLTPSLPPSALAAELDLDGLVDVTPGPGPALPLSLGELAVCVPPRDLLDAPEPPLPERTTLMAAPHLAVHGSRRIAVALSDPFHAVVYARDPEALRAALRIWLVARLDATIGASAPEVEGSHLGPLLEPLPDGSWRQLEVVPHRGFWALHFTTVTLEPDGRPVIGPPSRWIGAPQGSWRAGWSW